MKVVIYRSCVVYILVAIACVPFTSSFSFKPNNKGIINLLQLRSSIMILADLDQAPLDIIGGTAEELRDGVVSSLDFVREAYIPGSWEGFVSEAIANGIAGVLGSVISRGASNALGNKKKDSLTTKAATTGAFFGTRRVIRTVLRTLGLPVPMVVVLSSLVASALSSITKSTLRSASHMHNGGINDENPDSSMTTTSAAAATADEKLNYPEVLGDIHKWLVYDLLYKDTDFSPQSMSLMSLPYKAEAAAIPPIVSYDQSDTATEDAADYLTAQVDDTNNSALLFLLTLMSSIPVDQTILCFFYGAIAAVVGLAVIDATNSFMDSMTPLLDDGRPHNLYNNNNINGTNSSWGTKYAIVAVEGSLLFGCFQSIQNFLTQYIPEQYNVKFAFNTILQGALEGK